MQNGLPSFVCDPGMQYSSILLQQILKLLSSSVIPYLRLAEGHSISVSGLQPPLHIGKPLVWRHLAPALQQSVTPLTSTPCPPSFPEQVTGVWHLSLGSFGSRSLQTGVP